MFKITQQKIYQKISFTVTLKAELFSVKTSSKLQLLSPTSLSNFLKLNDDKTELLYFFHPKRLTKVTDIELLFGAVKVTPALRARDPGCLF